MTERRRLTERDAPKSLVAKLNENMAKTKELNWRSHTFYYQGTPSTITGHLVARRSLSMHVSESIIFAWTYSAMHRHKSPLHFNRAWRVLTTHAGTGDWRDNSVGSELQFRTINEAFVHLRKYAPSSPPKDDDEAILSASAVDTKSQLSKPTKKAGKKMAPAKSAAKKVAAKKTAPVKKAPAKKAAATQTAAATRASEVEARRIEREQEKEAQRAQVVNLRDKKEQSWTQISEAMGLDMNICNLRYLEATEYATPSNPTPSALRKARESENLSWIQIMAKFRFNTKAAAQKAYVEAGGDLAFQVGRGGRFIDQPNVPARAAKKAGAKKAAAPAKKVAAAKKAPAAKKSSATAGGKPVFDGSEPSPEVKAKIIGKKVTTKDGESFRVGDDVKVGAGKDGIRVAQFTDNGNRTTVALASIVKIGR